MRMLEEVSRGTGSGDVAYKPPMGEARLVEAAGKSHPLPYDRGLAVPLEGNIERTTLFPGPGETVVAWDRDDRLPYFPARVIGL